MTIEHIIQIEEDNNISQTIARYLTNDKNVATTIINIHSSYEIECEENYNDDYKYCVSVWFPEDNVLDEI